MFTKSSLALLIMLMLISLAGCGITNPSPLGSNTEPPNSQGNPSGTITDTTAADNYQMLPVINSTIADLKLDANADGTIQQLQTGQVMSVMLESNPSTGYSWYATSSNPNVLMQMGEPQYQAPSESATPMLGASGSQTFYYQAATKGSTTLTLEYKRSWETDITPVKTITITVEVP